MDGPDAEQDHPAHQRRQRHDRQVQGQRLEHVAGDRPHGNRPPRGWRHQPCAARWDAAVEVRADRREAAPHAVLNQRHATDDAGDDADRGGHLSQRAAGGEAERREHAGHGARRSMAAGEAHFEQAGKQRRCAEQRPEHQPRQQQPDDVLPERADHREAHQRPAQARDCGERGNRHAQEQSREHEVDQDRRQRRPDREDVAWHEVEAERPGRHPDEAAEQRHGQRQAPQQRDAKPEEQPREQQQTKASKGQQHDHGGPLP